jgi:hypothetical protein
MSPTNGLCGGGGPHLPSQRGRPTHYQAGPFVAQLTPTLIQKMFLEVPAELWVGLLVRPPNPDGDGYQELACKNYARSPN